jgi:hypothetical protein
MVRSCPRTVGELGTGRARGLGPEGRRPWARRAAGTPAVVATSRSGRCGAELPLLYGRPQAMAMAIVGARTCIVDSEEETDEEDTG